MRNAKHGSEWRITLPALLASLLALLACALPEQVTAADCGRNIIRLNGDFSCVAYDLQRPLQNGLSGADGTLGSFPVVRLPLSADSVLAGRQLEVARMQQDKDGQQGTTKPAPKPEPKSKPMPPSGTQKQQQPNRNTRSGMRISEDQFQSKFGRQHTFQIQHLNGNRFQTGGFVFEVVDVWPSVFSFDDPFFIDEVDEQFFLFDVNHPGVRTLVVVVQEL